MFCSLLFGKSSQAEEVEKIQNKSAIVIRADFFVLAFYAPKYGISVHNGSASGELL
jgi:hypothetical protein